MPPLTPAQCDLRGLPYMPLDCARLLESDTYALTTGEEFKAALTLWCRSWSQIPAASIPNADRILAKWAGVSLNEWRMVREQALRGWISCSDGRLYHPIVAEKALTAWLQRISLQERSAKGNEKAGRAVVNDPAHFARLRVDAEQHLAVVRTLIMPLPEGAIDSPTGSADPSFGESLGTPTGTDFSSEVEGEGEGEGEEIISVPTNAPAVTGKPVGHDVQQAFDAYNEAAEQLGLSQAAKLTESRRKGIMARLKEAGPDGWTTVLENLAFSPHHLGQNDRGWRADLDFIIKQDRFQRFLEGATIPADQQARRSQAGSGGSYLDLAAQAMQPSRRHAQAERGQQAALNVLARRGALPHSPISGGDA